jgi:hypothetical protein
VVPNQVDLTTTNPQPSQTTNAVQAAWATWAGQQNYTANDSVNDAQSNRDIWHASNNLSTPYPGDSRVLLPSQVPGGSGSPATNGTGGGG